MKELPSGLMRVLKEHHVNLEDGSLLTLALTHKSWANEQRNEHQGDNERLEFLGDAVVGLAIGEKLYNTFPTVPEGDLARMRAAIVCEPSLAQAGERLGLGQALRLSVGEEKSGGRKRASLLANAYEAVIGAVFFDVGMGYCATNCVILSFS